MITFMMTNERRIGEFRGNDGSILCGEECRRVTVHKICLDGSSDEKANKQRRDSQAWKI